MPHTEAMIALYPPPALAEALAVPGGEPADELHVTLAYLGEAADLTVGQLDTISKVVQAVTVAAKPITCRVSGLGRFNAPEGEPEPWYASVDAPGLTELRTTLVKALRANQIDVPNDHGFTPHMTLSYLLPGTPAPYDAVPDNVFLARALYVVLADNPTAYPLGSEERMTTNTTDTTERIIKHEGSKWVLYSSKGKVLGEFDSEEAAKKREKQITWFKNKEKNPNIKYGGKRSDTQPVQPVERFHDAFVDAMFERLKGKVNEDDWSTAVKYARAKAGGHAKAAADAARRETQDNATVLASLLTPQTLSQLSDDALAAVYPVLGQAIAA